MGRLVMEKISGKGGKGSRRLCGSLLFLACVLFAGCGGRECAICGNTADRKLEIGGKELDICTDCYTTYIEIQRLFEEED